jgi:hypothetical protein
MQFDKGVSMLCLHQLPPKDTTSRWDGGEEVALFDQISHYHYYNSTNGS